ncbi:putative cation transport protein [Actibacterium atlanticum]|uniref:glutathione-specific gamma-glutamylcyclotransferase n=1 Tax=Actibacterium atlanticum TaxID=1461693 RepID=A0A058ZQ19_9RHOB|nr:gamma-glutamylcyclotransferase [Actibacterium atlanticum]KCV82951.1 putative cation transport protein [Actibacterium atlanticum]
MAHKPLWVFGYGSLMWNPGFEVAEQQLARLDGYHRSFCMRSFHYRGTEERPGLVLALDRAQGASCHGLAFRVAPGTEQVALAGLRERELVSDAYLEINHDLTLSDGQGVQAVTYVIDRANPQYCGQIPLEDQAHIIARAHGARGPNTEYLYNTALHLEELGVADEELSWLHARVREILATGHL